MDNEHTLRESLKQYADNLNIPDGLAAIQQRIAQPEGTLSRILTVTRAATALVLSRILGMVDSFFRLLFRRDTEDAS
jgi:hypothetical protein